MLIKNGRDHVYGEFKILKGKKSYLGRKTIGKTCVMHKSMDNDEKTVEKSTLKYYINKIFLWLIFTRWYLWRLTHWAVAE